MIAGIIIGAIAAEAVKDAASGERGHVHVYRDDCEPHHVSDVSKEVVRKSAQIDEDVTDSTK